jgi:hypothetical protein
MRHILGRDFCVFKDRGFWLVLLLMSVDSAISYAAFYIALGVAAGMFYDTTLKHPCSVPNSTITEEPNCATS